VLQKRRAWLWMARRDQVLSHWTDTGRRGLSEHGTIHPEALLREMNAAVAWSQALTDSGSMCGERSGCFIHSGPKAMAMGSTRHRGRAEGRRLISRGRDRRIISRKPRKGGISGAGNWR